MEIRLLGITEKEEIDKQLNICAAAGKLSRMPGTVFDALENMKESDKALSFIERVIKMGHTSTVDHDYMVFAVSEVTPVIEQTIIAERFCSFTVKSRREVNFAEVGFYTPEFHDKEGKILANNKEIQKDYNNYMKSLFKSYQKFIDEGISKEDARFILPYCYHSELIMGLDSTSLVRMIKKLTKTKLSKISELKEFGEKLYEIAKTRVPYLKVLIEDEEEILESTAENILESLQIDNKYELLKEPILLSCTDNIDKTLFVNMIARISGKSVVEAENIYESFIKGNKELETKLMKALFKEIDVEDLKQINLRFQIPVPFAILTHFTRHRRLALSIPAFTNLDNINHYVTPPSIKNCKLYDLYKEIYAKNIEKLEKFKKLNIRDEDLIYFTLSGNAVNVIINFDGEAFRWICKLRECTKAQWYIRESVNKMHNLIREKSSFYANNLGPDCVTQHICKEGKESCGRLNVILEKLKKEGNINE